MLSIYTPEQASQTILRRVPLDEMPIPPALQDGIFKVFGEALSPEQAVRRILGDVRQRGDAALEEWSWRLDGRPPQPAAIPAADLEAALAGLPSEQRAALETAAGRINRFYSRQPAGSWIIEDGDGTLGQLMRPLRRVGLYIPGGLAPLASTVLMSAVPAQVAGVQQIAVAAPPRRGTSSVDPLTLAACALLGLTEVYAMGGAQAIAALAYGTQTIPAVDKIVGPGNLFVTLAKRQVFGVVGIDGLAGPTETMIIADECASPALAAADLLAQAEHDAMAAAILLTPSRRLAQAVQGEVARQVEALPRAETLAVSLSNRSGIVLTRDLEQAAELANTYAPEHLCLSVSDPWRLAGKIRAAGGVFLGESSFEVLGDYVAGPSHVMPTSGTARFASPLNVWDFVHLVHFVALDRETGAALSHPAAALARAEALEAHARAAEARRSLA